MTKRLVLGAFALVLVGGRSEAGVGVSPPGKAGFDPPAPIRVMAALGATTLEITQEIIGPDKPAGIIGPDKPVGITSMTHLRVCKSDSLLPPGPCTPSNVQIRVVAADEIQARAGGLLAAVGELAGIIGPDLPLILAKYGFRIQVTHVSGGGIAGIIGPERAVDLIYSSINAVAPEGTCTVDHVGGPPCLAALPSVFRTGASALGLSTSCGAAP